VRSGRSPRDSPGHAVAPTVAATTSSNRCSKLEPLPFRHRRRWRIGFTGDVTSDDERVTAEPSEVTHYTTWCLRRAEFLQAIPFSPRLCRDLVIAAIERDLLRQIRLTFSAKLTDQDFNRLGVFLRHRRRMLRAIRELGNVLVAIVAEAKTPRPAGAVVLLAAMICQRCDL
jgi:hypothetical protein